MELGTYLAILWRRKLVVVITTVVTVLVTAVGVFLMTPTYEASATLRVAPSGGLSVGYTELTYATQLKNTFVRLATSDRVLDELVDRLGLKKPPKVEMELLGNSELMLLSARHPNPRVAQEVANTVAQILIDLNRELYVQSARTAQEVLGEQLLRVGSELDQAWHDYQQTIAESPDDVELIQATGKAWELKQEKYTALLEQQEQARLQEVLRASALSVFDPADLPDSPAGLPKVLYVGLGGMVGLTAGVGLAFLFDNLDTTLRTPEQVEASSPASPLGKIPTARKEHPVAFFSGGSPQQEAFRRLRMNLFALGDSAPLQTLLVSSARPLEGKTRTVANLAYAIAEAGRRVVVVDCDLRRSSMHKIWEMPNQEGLSNALQADEPALNDLLRQTEVENLWILTGGPIPPKPTELLGSKAMVDLIEKLRQRFDVVLLDTPPLAAVADAAILAPIVDGVLLVVGCGQAREEDVRSACRQLADVNARLLGMIVNRVKPNGTYQYYHRQRR